MEIKTLNQLSFILPPVKKVGLVGLIFFIWLLNILSPLTTFERAKLVVLLRPRDPNAHLRLSELAAEALDTSLARREFDRAITLLNSSQPSIRGISSRFEEVGTFVFAERTITQEIDNLKKVVNRYPGSRDLYLPIPIQSYRLSDLQLASSYWRLARELDPNHPEVLEIGVLLGMGI